MTTHARLQQLVSELTEKTRAGRIKWSPMSDTHTYRYRGATMTVVVSRQPIGLVYQISLLAPDGEELLTHTDNPITGAIEHGRRVSLQPLYAAVEESTKEIDEQLDGFLDELDNL